MTRTQNADWFNHVGPRNSQQTAMKRQLRVGGAGTLNIYTVGFVSGSEDKHLGYATFPRYYDGARTDDGVVLLYSTLPGGAAAHFNLGRTGTHEVGRKCYCSLLISAA